MDKRPIYTRIPIELEFPDEMIFPIQQVLLLGEYESYYFGNNLVILDIGANVGAFSIWANLRWTNSRIYAYEPHPETFNILMRNVEGLTNIICYNKAVYPSYGKKLFFGRYAGDGQAGLINYIGEYIQPMHQDHVIEVDVLHPRDLPVCDIIKLDVEGPEAEILYNMDVRNVSLILLEYHKIEYRDAIKNLLLNEFDLEFEENYEDLSGRLFFANKYRNKLRKLDTQCLTCFSEQPWTVSELSPKKILKQLPSAIKRASKNRIRKILYYIKRLTKRY